MLPISKFYVHKGGYRKGKPFSECKICWRHRSDSPAKGNQQLVPMSDALPIFEELFRRIGQTAAARRIGVASDTISMRRLREKKSLRKSNYEAAVSVLEEARDKNEDGWDTTAARTSNLVAAGPRGRELELAKHLRKMDERRNRIVRYMDVNIKSPELLTQTDINALKLRGLPIPLDLVPHEYWHPRHLPYPRFGEEMLGEDF